MTLPRLFELYIPERKRLLTARVPHEGWTVSIHPEDSMGLDMDTPGGFGFGGYQLGAVWLIDATVPVGTIRIDTR